MADQVPEIMGFQFYQPAMWGPFPLEGYVVIADILGGTVKLRLRLNGAVTTVEMHPEHAAALGNAMIGAAAMSWMADNAATRTRQ